MTLPILILTEGSRTEPAYFCQLAQSLVLVPHEVRAATSPDPLNMLSEALAWRDAYSEKTDNAALPDVWLCLDTEVEQQDPVRWRRLRRMCEKANRYQVKVALAMPCFELWLLLHLYAFSFTEAQALSRQRPGELCRRLAIVAGKRYQKGNFPTAELTEPMLALALSQARDHQIGTGLATLVERLLSR